MDRTALIIKMKDIDDIHFIKPDKDKHRKSGYINTMILDTGDPIRNFDVATNSNKNTTFFFLIPNLRKYVSPNLYTYYKPISEFGLIIDRNYNLYAEVPLYGSIIKLTDPFRSTLIVNPLEIDGPELLTLLKLMS
ncbi:MAG: hypothetical protein KC414_14750 [Romboutsia sp.]|nr:hypothetical protein [Romboutsia sp.]